MLGTAPSKVTAGGDTTDGKNSKGGGNSTAGENYNFTDGNLNSTARGNSPQLLRMQIVKQLQMSILPGLHPSPQLSVFPHVPLSSLLISTANSKASAVNGRGSVSQFRQHSCNKFYIRSFLGEAFGMSKLLSDSDLWWSRRGKLESPCEILKVEFRCNSAKNALS